MIFRRKARMLILLTVMLCLPFVSPSLANTHTFSVIFGDWVIEDRRGNSIGFMNVFEVNVDAPQADGQLFKNAGFFTSLSSMDVRVRNLTREAFDFDVNFNSHSSGEQSQGRMLISLKGTDRNVLGGSIELDGRFILITLKRQQDTAPNASNLNSDDEEIYDDLPGFGVTGPAYRVRNVPEGNNLLIRSAPDRSASIVARLDVFATEILIINCSPEIDHVQFDTSNREGKRELLGGVWCRIQTPAPDIREGYVLGRYLDPILGR